MRKADETAATHFPIINFCPLYEKMFFYARLVINTVTSFMNKYQLWDIHSVHTVIALSI